MAIDNDHNCECSVCAERYALLRSSAVTAEPTPEQIDAALNAWFKSPPSETDQGLERSMKAALIAAGIRAAPQASSAGREAVAWQYRVQYDDGGWSDWMACKETMHDTYRALGKAGACPAETRELGVIDPRTEPQEVRK